VESRVNYPFHVSVGANFVETHGGCGHIET
jgi:hypothetical protein